MTHRELVEALGYKTWVAYDEYTPLSKKQFGTMYDKYYKKAKGGEKDIG